MAPRMGSLKCPFGTMPATYCGLSPLALGRTWKGWGTLVDFSQVPNGCPYWLKAINWAPLGLDLWCHPFPIAAHGTVFLPLTALPTDVFVGGWDSAIFFLLPGLACLPAAQRSNWHCPHLSLWKKFPRASEGWGVEDSGKVRFGSGGDLGAFYKHPWGFMEAVVGDV